MTASSSSAKTATTGASFWHSRFSWGQLFRFGAVATQLVLLTLVVRTFAVESTAFFHVMTIATVGFVVHHFMPKVLRLPVFVLISLAGIVFVMGISNAVQLVGLGLVVLGLAHTPVPFAIRVGLIVAFGGLLAALRIDAISSPLSSAIWPIFGAMFMFRLIVYLYDMRTRAAPFGFWRAMAYFFMLPNVAFPLFPVVDYKTFCRTYYDEEDIRVYQTGTEWMFRGVFQLLIYRWVYQNLMVGPESVTTALSAAIFVVTAYLMYLKISGSFHVIVGMLHLFGFNLMQTNNKYFLSESFTDYWRRINIYWKDFLQKVFFNPIYFRLNKRMGATSALVLATLTAFFVTWALHSYQWFWIRGRFPIIWQDIVFWSIMGLLVLGNVLYENKYGRQRSLTNVRHSFGSEFKLALRTVVTFVVVCMSWVVWSSETFSEFKMVLAHLIRPDATALLWIVGSLLALGVGAVVVARANRKKMGAATGLARLKRGPKPIWGGAWHVAASCVVMLVVAYAPLVVHVNPDISNVLDNLKTSKLNTRDSQMLDRGYYEDLTNVVRFNSALGDLYDQKPPNWDRCWALHPVDGYPDYELMPNRHVWHKGAVMSTNRWGMRDRDYEKEKPAGVRRIAVVGASHSMGTGVEDDQVYDNIVEDRLNAESAPQGVRCEILNFSVGGYGPIERLVDLDRRVLDFKPDVLIYVAVDDIYWIIKNIVDAARADFPVPYPYILDVIREANFSKDMALSEGLQKLAPRQDELVLWLYGQVVERCRERNITPVAFFIPQPRYHTDEVKARMVHQVELAEQAGFVVIDALDAYDDSDLRALHIAVWDSHPNADGHRLLAERLYHALKEKLNM